MILLMQLCDQVTAFKSNFQCTALYALLLLLHKKKQYIQFISESILLLYILLNNYFRKTLSNSLALYNFI